MTITRTKMDAQGRVILPTHIRRDLQLNPGQPLNVMQAGDTIEIRPDVERCHFCGKSVDKQQHTEITIGNNKRLLCAACAEAVAKATGKAGGTNDKN